MAGLWHKAAIAGWQKYCCCYGNGTFFPFLSLQIYPHSVFYFPHFWPVTTLFFFTFSSLYFLFALVILRHLSHVFTDICWILLHINKTNQHKVRGKFLNNMTHQKMQLQWRRALLHTSYIAVCVCLLSVGGAAALFLFHVLFFLNFNSPTSTVHFSQSPPPSLHQPQLEALHFMPPFALCRSKIPQSGYTTATIWQAYHQQCLQS